MIPNSKGMWGRLVNVGSEKCAIFGQYLAISWKRYKIGPRLIQNVNGKSYVADRSVSVLMTLSDLERWNIRGPFFSAYLHTCTFHQTSIKFGMVSKRTHFFGRGWYP